MVICLAHPVHRRQDLQCVPERSYPSPNVCIRAGLQRLSSYQRNSQNLKFFAWNFKNRTSFGGSLCILEQNCGAFPAFSETAVKCMQGKAYEKLCRVFFCELGWVHKLVLRVRVRWVRAPRLNHLLGLRLQLHSYHGRLKTATGEEKITGVTSVI